jgi:dihydrofolate synthase / folylpolyglutamate synthase
MKEYQQILDYLYAQLPMYHRIGAAAFKKDLNNTLALCAHLDNPQHQFKSIHIGGTNGKGSTSHVLAATLQAAGYKVGLYTSPHYKDFRERIKINGQYIDKQYIINFVNQHKHIFETIQPSFFEMTVAMAFAYFAAKKVDIAVIEVGLGGRLDSTNVITPLLSVITNISYDHMNMLGDSLGQIAFEKAGIIKPSIPVVIGETHPESEDVFKAKAVECRSPIVFADQTYRVENQHDGYAYAYKNNTFIDKFYLDGGLGRGSYQAKNIATILQTLELLEKSGLPVTQKHLREALLHLHQSVRFIGRWQKLGEQPLIIADSGHNEAGVRSAFEQISTLTFERLHLVTGFVNDKDVTKILSLYPSEATYYFAKANIPRGLDATQLLNQAQELGLKGKAYSSVKNALKAAKRNAKPDDLIVVLGSIFVVAEIL